MKVVLPSSRKPLACPGFGDLNPVLYLRVELNHTGELGKEDKNTP